jgi:integrase
LGYWQKKIRGKIHYFGRWGRIVNGKMERLPGDGAQEALGLYQSQRDDLFAGRPSRAKNEGLTVGEMCNRFLTAKLALMESGEIAARTFAEYRGTTDRLVATFGKNRAVDDLTVQDFEKLRANIAKVWGPVRLGNEITRVKTVFKHGRKSDLVPPEFKKPSKAVLRKHRANNGKRLFSAQEIRSLLDVASPPVRAMILLGINCGFGNADCAALPQSAVDLKSAFIHFPRPKTGIDRACPLWTETVEALKVASAERPAPKDAADDGLVFVTKYGHRWVRTGGERERRTPIDAVAQEFGKALGQLKIERPGLGFYALRHTFRTVADAARDIPAARVIMGHADGSIDDVYREEIDDGRLRAVAEHVHGWLFGKEGGQGNGGQ